MSDTDPCDEHLCKQINALSSELMAVIERSAPVTIATAITALAT